MLKEHLTATQHEYIEIIGTSSDALLTVINDVLDFFKIEAGKMTISPHLFDLHDLMDKLMALFKPQTDSRGIDNPQLGGTGLGLSISHRLVQLMGGTISARSEKGKGSAFTVSLRLPLRRESEENEGAGEVKCAGRKATYRILVAEDNKINQKVIATTLSLLGHNSHIVENGYMAIEALKSNGHFDLILMDCHMPEMDGCEAAASIRSLDDPGLRCFLESFDAHDLMTAASSLSVWAKSSFGGISMDDINSLRPLIPGLVIPAARRGGQAEAIYLAAQEQPGKAVEILEKHWDTVFRKGVPQEYVVAVLPWLVTMHRLTIEQEAAGQGRGKSLRLSGRAMKLARQPC